MYRAYHDRLADHAYRYVRSVEIAEELVQDTFAAIWHNRATLDVRTGLEPYLFSAIRNRALRVRARDAMEHRITDDPAGARATVVGTNPARPDDAFDMAEMDIAVERAIAQLPGRAAHILFLRWKYAMTYAEIAAALGVTAEAAQKQGRRAIERLRPLFETLLDDRTAS
jgi:RNA polymerase sigma-70 factor (ECF subfamily)